MHDELTKVDIKKMQEEIDYRINVLTPKLKEELSKARAQGDLSENFEYKSSKRELSRNYSRINYLQRMIATAVVVSTDSGEGEIGLGAAVEITAAGAKEAELVGQGLQAGGLFPVEERIGGLHSVEAVWLGLL